MKAEQLMTRKVVTVTDAATLADAARAMWSTDCGFLPVVGAADGRLQGVITDRDICMGAMTQGRPLHEIPVSASMCRNGLHTCEPGTPIKEVQQTMREYKIRRLPVVDSNRRILGVVSLNDLATRSRAPKGRVPELAPAEICNTLASICERTEALKPEAGAEAAAEG